MTFPLSDREFERQYATAVKRGAARRRNQPLATSVRCDAERGVMIQLDNGCLVCMPLVLFPELAGASPNDLQRVEILGAGQAIEWPTLDQQFDIAQLLAETVGGKTLARRPAQRGGRTKSRLKAAARANGSQRGRPRKRGRTPG